MYLPMCSVPQFTSTWKFEHRNPEVLWLMYMLCVATAHVPNANMQNVVQTKPVLYFQQQDQENNPLHSRPASTSFCVNVLGRYVLCLFIIKPPTSPPAPPPPPTYEHCRLLSLPVGSNSFFTDSSSNIEVLWRV